MPFLPTGETKPEASLQLTVGKRLVGMGYYEPSLKVAPLPRCHVCGAKHPLAWNPPLADASRCPNCDATLPPPPPAIDVPAVLTGRSPSTLLARALLAIGSFFANLWKARQ